MYEPVPSREQQQSTAAESNSTSMRRHVIYKDCDFPPSRPIQTMQSEITSSLFLQELMYYNVFYSCVFVYLYLASQVYRLLYMSTQYGVPVRFILLAIFVPLEYFRLLNGFTGNLKETFPEVLAFFLLTIFSLADQLICMMIVPPLPLEFSLLLYGVIMHSLELLVWQFPKITKYILNAKFNSSSNSIVLLEEFRLFKSEHSLPSQTYLKLLFSDLYTTFLFNFINVEMLQSHIKNESNYDQRSTVIFSLAFLNLSFELLAQVEFFPILLSLFCLPLLVLSELSPILFDFGVIQQSFFPVPLAQSIDRKLMCQVQPHLYSP